MDSSNTLLPEINDRHISDFVSVVGEENVLTDYESVEKLSKDFYWYSPILKKQLEGKQADVAIKVGNLDELKAIVSLCAKNRLPITLRGGGTGNYGQCIPLYRGVVVDISPMNRIISLDGGVARVEPGARLFTIETEARKLGWEMRCLPTTFVKSTMGGFLCGGSGGIGSITHGMIRSGDNMKSVTFMSVEEEPKLRKFEGEDAGITLHTYGTNGILVEAEMRLTPKVSYDQMVFVSRDWNGLLDWADGVSRDDSIHKRLVSMFEWPVPANFLSLKKYLPEGHHVVFLTVKQDQSADLLADALKRGIEHTRTIPDTEPMRPPYLSDFTWNHTTLWVMKKNPTFTNYQIRFGPNFQEQIRLLWEKFPGEIQMHMEWIRVDDDPMLICLPLIDFISEERLNEISDFFKEIGIYTANPHTYILEEGGMHNDIEEKRALKKEMDPHGILNPGKMVSYPHNPFEKGSA